MDSQEESEGSDIAVKDGDTKKSNAEENKSAVSSQTNTLYTSKTSGFDFKLPIQSSMSAPKVSTHKSDDIAARPKATPVRRSLQEFFDLPTSFHIPLTSDVNTPFGYQYSTLRVREKSFFFTRHTLRKEEDIFPTRSAATRLQIFISLLIMFNPCPKIAVCFQERTFEQGFMSYVDLDDSGVISSIHKNKIINYSLLYLLTNENVALNLQVLFCV